jgi:hypothetical protein
MNNILRLTFYQSQKKKQKKINKTLATPSKPSASSSKHKASDSSSDSSASDDDDDNLIAPSPSKYVEASILMADLPPKAKEILSTISACKKLVKYIKTVSTATYEAYWFISFNK